MDMLKMLELTNPQRIRDAVEHGVGRGADEPHRKAYEAGVLWTVLADVRRALAHEATRGEDVS